jgi:hypothetical protein
VRPPREVALAGGWAHPPVGKGTRMIAAIYARKSTEKTIADEETSHG